MAMGNTKLLTHWGRVTHICVSKLAIIGTDNGFSPGRRQAIIWTNDGILLIRTFRTHFSEIVSEIHTFLLKKMHLKMSSGKWRPSCPGLNVLLKSCFYRYAQNRSHRHVATGWKPSCHFMICYGSWNTQGRGVSRAERWDKIQESYMRSKAENGRYLFSLFIIPRVGEIPLAIFAECELQFINLFMVKPRKLKHETRSIFLSIICYHPLLFNCKTSRY